MTTGRSGTQVARIPIEPEVRDKLQLEKRGKENWTQLLDRIYREWLQMRAER